MDLLSGTLLVFLATSFGAFPAYFLRRMGHRLESLLLGMCAGVMLGATFFSLLLPGLDAFQAQGYSSLVSALFVGLGILVGAALLLGFHHLIPHEHLLKVEGLEGSEAHRALSRQWLLILAVALHNVPEGLAVGVGLASGDAKLGTTLTTAIAFQDFPEGWIVAVGLMAIGMSFARTFWITAFTGLMESAGVVAGYLALQLAQSLLPSAFALCAGAMLFVVSHEVIPESHRKGFELHATGGVLIGFILMMVLDLGLA